jgi:GTP-binding protein YchF
MTMNKKIAMATSVGLVGLPNVGKSSLFNLLNTNNKAYIANYPFATIEPNIATSFIYDGRLQQLAQIVSSQKIIWDTVQIHDIAGLVKNASQGAGLGNRFLSHIREVDAIVHVVRCFQDVQILHVDGTQISPEHDIETIDTELLMADLDSVEKRLESKHLKHLSKINPSTCTNNEREILELCKTTLLQGKPIRYLIQQNILPTSQIPQGLLTGKPVLFALVTDHPQGDDEITSRVTHKLNKEGYLTCPVSCAIELGIDDDEESNKSELQELFGVKESSSSRLVRCIAQLLQKRVFFTVGPQEARAWSISMGETAQQAAGRIHTDISKGFIAAEVTPWNLYSATTNNHFRLEGAQYIVNDGDVILFRHSSKHK